MASHNAGNGSNTRTHLESWLTGSFHNALHRRRPDATQEALLALLEQLDRGVDPLHNARSEQEWQARIGGYVRTSAWHQACNDHRKQSRFGEAEPLEESTSEDVWQRVQLDPEREYSARESLQRLGLTADEAAFLAPDELPAPEDEALAAHLGITLNTLHQRRSRRRARLPLTH